MDGRNASVSKEREECEICERGIVFATSHDFP